MDFNQLNFMHFVIKKDLLLVLFKLLQDIYLVDLQLLVGIKVIHRKMTLNLFYSLSTNKQNTLLLKIMETLFNAINHMVQHLVIVPLSIFRTIQILTVKVMSRLVVNTIFPLLLMVIRYLQMEIIIFKQLK